jgi:anhydro-N-acetylmuramic acid kinase
MSGTSADGVDVAFVAVPPQLPLTQATHTPIGATECKLSRTGDAQTWPETAALSAPGENGPRLLHYSMYPYSPAIRAAIFALRGGGGAIAKPFTLAALCALTADVSAAYAAAINAAAAAAGLDLSCTDVVTAVGVHGQTLFHAPPVTFQAVDPSLVAARTGCDIVSDFRRADCAAGGQGAPLVPYADFALFRHAERTRVLVNLGGIANITVVPAGQDTRPDDMLAFDTGPANCVADCIVRAAAAAAAAGGGGAAAGGVGAPAWLDVRAQAQPAGVAVSHDDWAVSLAAGYDVGGRIAACGTVHGGIVATVLEDPYFRRDPPKSTDTPAMLAIFEAAAAAAMATAAGGGSAALGVADALATGCAVTAASLARGIALGLRLKGALPTAGAHREHAAAAGIDVVVSGGGTENGVLMRMLAAQLEIALGVAVDVGGEAPAPGPSASAAALARPPPALRLLTTDALGWPSAAKEAVAFALLAAATVDRLPANVPSCTGARAAVVLGSVTPAPVPRHGR